jgi:low affinity Fe/Cu permease
MTAAARPADTGASLPEPEHVSVFERIADYVSAAMGRPANIMVWLVLVIGWTLLFATHLVSPDANFLPSWFTGTAFNFPLNLITTVAELFIGFLVAAASNRSERNLDRTLVAIAAQEAQIREVEAGMRSDLTANTDLTRKVHVLQEQQMKLLDGIQQLSAELAAIRAAITPPPKPARRRAAKPAAARESRANT